VVGNGQGAVTGRLGALDQFRRDQLPVRHERVHVQIDHGKPLSTGNFPGASGKAQTLKSFKTRKSRVEN
jgi:hypothetical protein